MGLHYVTQQRPITDALRRSVTEDLPEIGQIGNADLRRKAVEAWAFALSHSSFGRITDPVARDVQLDDHAMMHQPVDRCRRHHRVFENRFPF